MTVQVNLEALLAQAPFSQLDEAFRSYAQEALDQECDAEEAAEVLGPYLLDAGLATSEEQVRQLVGCNGTAPSQEGPTLLAAPTSIGQLAVSEQKPSQAAGAPDSAVAATTGKGLSAARQAAKTAEEVKAALAPGAALELTVVGDQASEAVARLLPAEVPCLVDSGQEQYLAASFVAFAEEREPSELREWAALLREVLEDAGVTVDGEELMEVATRVAERCIRKGLLKAKARQSCPGDVVLAVLPEDGEWHEAIVDSLAEDGVLRLIFVEYGKPLEVLEADVRYLDDVADDEDAGELQDGCCEMCQRTTKLTFHHLIPKDKHPTYMGKRLPRGIEGEPTRHFLNSYGLMICRQCHNTVHRIASNEVLANDYNTLAKIMEHPTVQRFVGYISQQRASCRGR